MKALMNIVDEADDGISAHDQQIAAVGQLIADRTDDANSPSKLRTDSFVSIINKMGLPLTKETLMDLKEKGTLDAVIKDVNPDEINFKGQRDIDPTQMTVDRARNTVDKMAKRNAKKGIMK